MDLNVDNPRVLQKELYRGFIQVLGIALATNAQVIEGTLKDKILISICLATMLVNFIVATWLFSQTGDMQMQHKDWKTFMFKLTRVVSLHFAFSLLLPEWFTWLGFATICTIMIFKELAGHNKLQPIYDWSYKKFDSAMDYASTMFLVRDQEFAADNAV